MLDQIIESRLLGSYHKPSTYFELRKPRTRTGSDWFQQLYADERYRINQMDGNAIHAKEMGWEVVNGAHNASEKVEVRTRQIGARSDACYKSLRFHMSHVVTRTLRVISTTFSPILTALLHPISSPVVLGPSPSFGKSPFCSRSLCVRDDKRLASPSRSRMV